MNLIFDILGAILSYLKSDWMILLVGSLIAVVIKVYVDPKQFKSYIDRKSKSSIISSVGFGALTPLCACGTMAVLLSMFVTSMPWGPVMAFLVSSPLTGPSEYYFQSAFFGFKFANTVLIVSIVMGLIAGFLAHVLDKKTRFFENQFRLQGDSCTTCKEGVHEFQELDVELTNKSEDRFKLKQFMREFYHIGVKRILLLFVIFIAISQLVELLIPAHYIFNLFSGEKSYSVFLASLIGLPLYVSGPSAIPLLKTMIENGAGEGAILAFLITGKATGIPVMLGMSTIIKKRAILFYILFVWISGMISGYLYLFFLA
jgi:uncharacterized protein